MIKLKTIKALKKKIETLRTNILSKTVSEDDEQLLRTLTGRVHTNICYDIIDAACNCAAIVAGIITLTPVPVAAQLVSAVLFTVCAVETLVLWTIKNVFTNQNPFSSTSKSPVMKAIDIVSTSIRSIPRRIHEVFDHIHAHHVPVHVAA